MRRDDYTGIKYRVRAVNPADAKTYLALNIKKNRNLNKRRSEAMARDMAEGRWGISPPIVLTREGNMLDGQHRMQAIVLSQTTVTMCFMEGVSESSYKHWDSGRSRSAKDTLIYAGCPGWAASSAVQLIRSWIFFQDDRLHQLSTGGGAVPITNEQAVASWEADAEEIMAVLSWFKTAGARFLQVNGLKIVYYLTNWRHPRLATEFVNCVAAPPRGQPDHPAAALRRALEDHFIAGSASLSNKRLSRSQQLAYPIIAWNAFAKKKKVKHLRWGVSKAKGKGAIKGSFPDLYLP